MVRVESNIPGVSSDWHNLSHHGRDESKIEEPRLIEFFPVPMPQITFQPSLRPALLEVTGCKDYREERELFMSEYRGSEAYTGYGQTHILFKWRCIVQSLHIERDSQQQQKCRRTVRKFLP